MAVRGVIPETTRVWVVVLIAFAMVGWIAASAWANPFETLPPDHWSYDAVKMLSRKGMIQRYVEHRLLLGYEMTYFDVAMWLGEAFERYITGEDEGLTFSAFVEAFNAEHPESALGQEEREQLADLIEMVQDHLEMLGYPVPLDGDGRGRTGIRFQGVARALEQFRMRGESRIVYQDVTSRGDGEGDGVNVAQTHTLRLSGPVSSRLNIGAVVRGEGRMSAENDDGFRLGAEGVDLGFPGSALARIGRVTGSGMSDLAIGGVRELTGFQAAVQTGRIGSMLLVGRTPAKEQGPLGEKDEEALVTAWDGSFRVNDRLQLGASLAYLQADSGDGEDHSQAVVSLGGTYAVTPQLTLATEMAQATAEGEGGSALRVGAVLHPLPELTLGALLSSTGEGYRPLFGTSEGARSRIDLSAEIGRWILSLRREHVVRSESDEGGNSTVTRLGLASYLNENTILKAARETGEGSGAGSGEQRDVKTELDLEIRFELGKIGLGFAIESGATGSEDSGSTVRRTRAMVEHAVGPIGRASAGFSIVDRAVGAETSSNVGLRYDFENASVMLQYEILTKVGEAPENVTTAEVSIKF